MIQNLTEMNYYRTFRTGKILHNSVALKLGESLVWSKLYSQINQEIIRLTINFGCFGWEQSNKTGSEHKIKKSEI